VRVELGEPAFEQLLGDHAASLEGRRREHLGS